MAIDIELLNANRMHEEQSLGIVERFVDLNVGGGRTVGILATPIGEQRGPSWIVCQPFGAEHVHLYQTEVTIARGLAAAGYPVLRFHCQGYGDSEHLDVAPGFTDHIRDTREAYAQMEALVGAAPQGIIGLRLGGTVAAIVAADLGLRYVVMVSPVANGRRYVTELMRSQRISVMSGGLAGKPSAPAELGASLSSGETVIVEGAAVTPAIADDLRGIDFVAQPPSITGHVLLIQISLAEKSHDPLTKLVDRLQVSAASSEMKVIEHPEAFRFGHEHYHTGADGVRESGLQPINDGIRDLTIEWIGTRARESEGYVA